MEQEGVRKTVTAPKEDTAPPLPTPHLCGGCCGARRPHPVSGTMLRTQEGVTRCSKTEGRPPHPCFPSCRPPGPSDSWRHGDPKGQNQATSNLPGAPSPSVSLESTQGTAPGAESRAFLQHGMAEASVPSPAKSRDPQK